MTNQRRPANAVVVNNAPLIDDDGDVRVDVQLSPTGSAILAMLPDEVELQEFYPLESHQTLAPDEPPSGSVAEASPVDAAPSPATDVEGGVPTPQPMGGPGSSGAGSFVGDEVVEALMANPALQAKWQITMTEKNLLVMNSIAKSLMNLEVIFGGIEQQLLMFTELEVQKAKVQYGQQAAPVR